MKEKKELEKLIDSELDLFVPPINDKMNIDIDKAWDRVRSQISEPASEIVVLHRRQSILFNRLMKIAAAILILASLTTSAILIHNKGTLSKPVIANTDNTQKNKKITLPDGSHITLNSNTTLTYNPGFGKRNRKVSLSGEAFFEITADASMPFIIDAGKASIKVIGTSFNVITENIDSAVEVFVQSGKVMLYDNSGKRDMLLEPGYIGTMDSGHAGKTLNENPNYMAWNNGKLEYDGQSLDVVIRDLKRVFNMDITVSDPSILDNRWTSPIDIESRDTIIRLICVSFNLSYTKDGDIYHLSKK